MPSQREPFDDAVIRYQRLVYSAITEESKADTAIGPFLIVETRDGDTGGMSFPGNLWTDPDEELRLAVREMRKKNVYRYGFMMNALLTDRKLSELNALPDTEFEQMIEDTAEVISLSVVDPFNVALHVAAVDRRSDGSVGLASWQLADPVIDPHMKKLRRAVCWQG
jgi:hypothetical protein